MAAAAMSAVTLPASVASSSSDDLICSALRCARSRSNDASISERRSRNPTEILEISSEADCSSQETSPLSRAAAASSSVLGDPTLPGGANLARRRPQHVDHFVPGSTARCAHDVRPFLRGRCFSAISIVLSGGRGRHRRASTTLPAIHVASSRTS